LSPGEAGFEVAYDPHSAVLHWCGALYDLGAATQADRTLWYASIFPEELLARPWGEPEYLEEFRVERTTRKDHCLHRCEVPSSDAGALAGYLGHEVALKAEGSSQR
jgi:hypothetical protein